MLYELQTDVYPWLRRSANLSQRALEKSTGISRSKLSRIETGKRPVTRQEEDAIRLATGCSREFFAELICKSLSETFDTTVSIGTGAARGHRGTAPEAEAYELLRAGRRVMPRSLWWSWKSRLGRIRALGLWLEQEVVAILGDLRALLWELEDRQEKADAEASPEVPGC